MAALQEHPWLARLVAPHLDPVDRLAPALASRAMHSHLRPALFEHLQLAKLGDWKTLATRLRRDDMGRCVRTIELKHISCNAALFTSTADDLLSLCPRLHTLQLTLSTSPVPPSRTPISIYVCPDQRKRHLPLAEAFRRYTPQLQTLIAILPTQNERNSMPDDRLPLLLSPLETLIVAISPSSLILQNGFLPLAPSPSATMKTIELNHVGLLSGTLAAIIEGLEAGQELKLTDVRLQLTPHRWHAMSPLNGQSASSWLHLASKLQHRETKAGRGARVVMSCACGPAGRRSHLPGGWRGEAAPDAREAVETAFEARGIAFEVEEDLEESTLAKLEMKRSAFVHARATS